MGVRLLPNPQCVQLSLKRRAIDYVRDSKFISHELCHRSLPRRPGALISFFSGCARPQRFQSKASSLSGGLGAPAPALVQNLVSAEVAGRIVSNSSLIQSSSGLARHPTTTNPTIVS